MMGAVLSRAGTAACALMILIAPARAADAQLGRLFFTPAQRSSLDIARTQRARTTLSTEKTEETTAPPAPETLTYQGAVRRSDGKATVFVNGQPITEKGSGPSSIVVGRVRPDGGVSLQVPQTGRMVDLKPGQSVELLSGVIEESFSRKAAQPEPKPPLKGESAAKEARSPEEGSAASGERPAREDQQRKFEEALRELRDAASAKSAAGAKQQDGSTPASPPRTN